MKNLAELLKTSLKRPTNASKMHLRTGRKTWMPKYKVALEVLLLPRKSEPRTLTFFS
jgi:hypothetical protein